MLLVSGILVLYLGKPEHVVTGNKSDLILSDATCHYSGLHLVLVSKIPSKHHQVGLIWSYDDNMMIWWQYDDVIIWWQYDDMMESFKENGEIVRSSILKSFQADKSSFLCRWVALTYHNTEFFMDTPFLYFSQVFSLLFPFNMDFFFFKNCLQCLLC